MLRATTPCTFSSSQLPKLLRTPQVFNTFYFQICFAPQRHALFQHFNFQKWSGAEVLCTFSLRNRLRATTACNFSSLISPDVSAPAALASLLFDPPEPQNHEKTQCFATFLPFRAPASSFFWSFLFWLFSLLTAFSSLHIVGSLTSKLPSIMIPILTFWANIIHQLYAVAVAHATRTQFWGPAQSQISHIPRHFILRGLPICCPS